MIEGAGHASGLTATAGFGNPPLLVRPRLVCRLMTMQESHRSDRYGQGSEGAVMAQKEGKSPQVVRVSKTDCEAGGYGIPFILP